MALHEKNGVQVEEEYGWDNFQNVNQIKPSTPESLRRYNLSSYDQMMSPFYVSCVFFYNTYH